MQACWTGEEMPHMRERRGNNRHAGQGRKCQACGTRLEKKGMRDRQEMPCWDAGQDRKCQACGTGQEMPGERRLAQHYGTGMVKLGKNAALCFIYVIKLRGFT